jgi:hypothetical protein|eukprot:COSAG01_NODE_191_length_22545_cov_259.478838_9_plen_539_part_00
MLSQAAVGPSNLSAPSRDAWSKRGEEPLMPPPPTVEAAAKPHGGAGAGLVPPQRAAQDDGVRPASPARSSSGSSNVATAGGVVAQPPRESSTANSLSARIQARTRTLSVSLADVRPSARTPPAPPARVPDDVVAAHARERLREILACSPSVEESPLAMRGLEWADALPSVEGLSLAELERANSNPLDLMRRITEDAHARRSPTTEPDDDEGGTASYIGAVLAAQMSASASTTTTTAIHRAEAGRSKETAAIKIQARVRGNQGRARKQEIRQQLRLKQARQRQQLQELHEVRHEQDSAWLAERVHLIGGGGGGGGGAAAAVEGGLDPRPAIEAERLARAAQKQEGADAAQKLKREHDAEHRQQQDALTERQSLAEQRLQTRKKMRQQLNAGMGVDKKPCCRDGKVAPIPGQDSSADATGAGGDVAHTGTRGRARATRQAFVSYFQLMRRHRALLAASVGFVFTVFAASVLVLLTPGVTTTVIAWAVVAGACTAWRFGPVDGMSSQTSHEKLDVREKSDLRAVEYFLWVYSMALFLVLPP